ncbi:hypothetical protein ACLOJK_040272 [Asimina triloba]
MRIRFRSADAIIEARRKLKPTTAADLKPRHIPPISAIRYRVAAFIPQIRALLLKLKRGAEKPTDQTGQEQIRGKISNFSARSTSETFSPRVSTDKNTSLKNRKRRIYWNPANFRELPRFSGANSADSLLLLESLRVDPPVRILVRSAVSPRAHSLPRNENDENRKIRKANSDRGEKTDKNENLRVLVPDVIRESLFRSEIIQRTKPLSAVFRQTRLETEVLARNAAERQRGGFPAC